MLEKSVRNIKLTVAYDGTGYHGFQRQANAMTIQQIIEERLAKIFGHELKLNMSARTDTGVHAYGQIVNFYTTGSIPVEKITTAAKSLLPDDIVVCAAENVPPNFHARFDANGKIYKYQIYNNKIADPFLRHYAWHIGKQLDIEAMHKAVQHTVGTHDFSAFRASGGATISPVRTILSASVVRDGKMIDCNFWGNGFLYHMVRNLVGTLINVGLKRISPIEFDEILRSCNRGKAGITAPPQGLYLCKVIY